MKSTLLAASLIFLGGAPAPAQNPNPPLKLIDSIPMPGVQGRIDHFTIDLRHQIVFVATLGSNSVQAVSLPKKKIIAAINGLAEPQGVVYVPENQRLYEANGGDGTVRIYDATGLSDESVPRSRAAMRLVKSVVLGDDADNLRYDETSRTIWVGYGGGAIASLDLDGDKLKEVRLGAHPEAFAIEKHGSKIYVNVPRKKEVAVVDRQSMAVITTYGTGTALGNYPMAFDEKDRNIFIGCREPATLLVLGSADGKIAATLDTVNNADDLFYDAELHRVYVLGGGGSVSIYEHRDDGHQSGHQRAVAYREISRIGTGPGGRTGLLIPEMHELLVALPHRGQQQAAIQVYTTR